MVMKSRRLMLPPAKETAECDSESLALFDRLARKKASGAMSLMGQSLPKWAIRATSAFPPIATNLRTWLVVGFVPKPDIAHTWFEVKKAAPN
jgi:hypothetical protein